MSEKKTRSRNITEGYQPNANRGYQPTKSKFGYQPISTKPASTPPNRDSNVKTSKKS